MCSCFVVSLSFPYSHSEIKVFYRLETKFTVLPDKCQEPAKGARDVVQMVEGLASVLVSQLDTARVIQKREISIEKTPSPRPACGQTCGELFLIGN